MSARICSLTYALTNMPYKPYAYRFTNMVYNLQAQRISLQTHQHMRVNILTATPPFEHTQAASHTVTLGAPTQHPHRPSHTQGIIKSNQSQLKQITTLHNSTKIALIFRLPCHRTNHKFHFDSHSDHPQKSHHPSIRTQTFQFHQTLKIFSHFSSPTCKIFETSINGRD